jgi:uncharacterized protein
MKRYLEAHITDDLPKKMVFIGGPRQVGKTILDSVFTGGSTLVIFDEIHKYRDWKNHLSVRQKPCVI